MAACKLSLQVVEEVGHERVFVPVGERRPILVGCSRAHETSVIFLVDLPWIPGTALHREQRSDSADRDDFSDTYGSGHLFERCPDGLCAPNRLLVMLTGRNLGEEAAKNPAALSPKSPLSTDAGEGHLHQCRVGVEPALPCERCEVVLVQWGDDFIFAAIEPPDDRFVFHAKPRGNESLEQATPLTRVLRKGRLLRALPEVKRHGCLKVALLADGFKQSLEHVLVIIVDQNYHKHARPQIGGRNPLFHLRR